MVLVNTLRTGVALTMDTLQEHVSSSTPVVSDSQSLIPAFTMPEVKVSGLLRFVRTKEGRKIICEDGVRRLRSRYPGGFDDLPPYEQYLSEEERKVISRQGNIRYEIILAGCVRFIIPPEVVIRTQDSALQERIITSISNQIAAFLQSNHWTSEQINEYIRNAKPTAFHSTNRHLVDIHWQKSPRQAHLPELPRLERFTLNWNERALVYAATGPNTPADVITIAVKSTPASTDIVGIVAAFEKFLGKSGRILEVWQGCSLFENNRQSLRSDWFAVVQVLEKGKQTQNTDRIISEFPGWILLNKVESIALSRSISVLPHLPKSSNGEALDKNVQ